MKTARGSCSYNLNTEKIAGMSKFCEEREAGDAYMYSRCRHALSLLFDRSDLETAEVINMV